MPMASATPLPSGVNPPLTTDNDDNHGGLVVIMTSLALVLVLASLAARIFSAVQRHIFQRDDLLFGILVVGWSFSPAIPWRCSSIPLNSTSPPSRIPADRFLNNQVVSIVQVAVVFCQVHHGWGVRTEFLTVTHDPLLKASRGQIRCRPR
jgi:hypothetical protein